MLISVFAFRFSKSFDTSFQPTVCQIKGFFCVIVLTWVGRAFIECHYDVCTQCSLDIDYSFRRKNMFGTVYMGTKYTTLFRKFASVSERIDLKAPAVGKHGLVPRIEFLNATRLTNNLQSGTEI